MEVQPGGCGRPAQMRRNTLKTLAITGFTGIGLTPLETWQQPVINAVVLPAHAQTSPAPRTASPAEALPDVQPRPRPPDYRVVIDPSFDCETVLPYADGVSVSVNVSPIPPPGALLDVNVACTGERLDFAVPLDTAGSALIEIDPQAFCRPVIEDPAEATRVYVAIEAGYAGRRAICGWPFEIPGQPSPPPP